MIRQRTAFVTGASRGIGKSVAQLLSQYGYQLITPSRNELDLSNSQSIEAYLSANKLEVDILVNNAGINPIADFTSLDLDIATEVIQVNVLSPLRLMKSFIPGMIQRNYGRIVNISSVWGVVSKKGRSIYSLTKDGLDGLTRSVAVEVAGHNVLVNSVAPGFVNTELTKKNNTPEQLNAIVAGIPIGRLAEPEEIAELILFLCSEKNTFITGQRIVIDGGFTCQ